MSAKKVAKPDRGSGERHRKRPPDLSPDLPGNDRVGRSLACVARPLLGVPGRKKE